MENLVEEKLFGGVYKGKRVLVTGHTGFKGSWLCTWLKSMGAEVCGFSDKVPTEPAHIDTLDLDIKSAVDTALSLSLKEIEDPILIRNDFQKIVRFCLSSRGFDMSGKHCAKLASDVLQNTVKYNQAMSPYFLDLYEFSTENKKLNLAHFQALELAKEITSFGPESIKNFKNGYLFAISKKGLDKSKKEAIEFAKLMAKRTIKLESSRK